MCMDLPANAAVLLRASHASAWTSKLWVSASLALTSNAVLEGCACTVEASLMTWGITMQEAFLADTTRGHCHEAAKLHNELMTPAMSGKLRVLDMASYAGELYVASPWAIAKMYLALNAGRPASRINVSGLSADGMLSTESYPARASFSAHPYLSLSRGRVFSQSPNEGTGTCIPQQDASCHHTAVEHE